MQNETNFYAWLKNESKENVKNIFISNGWECRKASWFDFELENVWPDLLLEGESNEPLLNGLLDYSEGNLKILNDIFEKMDSSFLYEIYDKNKNLIFAKKHKWDF